MIEAPSEAASTLGALFEGMAACFNRFPNRRLDVVIALLAIRSAVQEPSRGSVRRVSGGGNRLRRTAWKGMLEESWRLSQASLRLLVVADKAFRPA